MTWDGITSALAGVPVVASDHYLIAQCDHSTLAAAMREAGVVADALVVDAPYSERTHAGHDSQEAYDESGAPRSNKKRQALGLPSLRRGLDYTAWSDSDVTSFVSAWTGIVSGWVCSLTDHSLAVSWTQSLDAAGRYVFAPLACVEEGSRCRMSGDGPSQWSTWLVASRPRERRWQSWGTLPGAYVGGREAKAVVGGKPLWLMRALVGDYSREGDLVVDPCMGAGTTLVAAVELGRRAIGCEPDAGRFQMAAKRLGKARPQMRMRLDVEARAGVQQGLSMGGE